MLMRSRLARHARLLAIVLGVAGGVLALRVSVLGRQPAAPAAATSIPGEILVRFRPDASPARQDAAMGSVAGAVLRRFTHVAAGHIRLPPGMSFATAAAVLMANPDVLAVQPNYVRHID